MLVLVKKEAAIKIFPAKANLLFRGLVLQVIAREKPISKRAAAHNCKYKKEIQYYENGSSERKIEF